MSLQPKAVVELEPKAPCRPREPDASGRPVPLASYVSGLEALPVRCPRHEEIEIAVDEKGQLHLLGEEGMLRQMQVVRRWAIEHRELLALALPKIRIDLSRPPHLHLFAEEPIAVADLHASDLRLHVLAPVKVGDQTGWYTRR